MVKGRLRGQGQAQGTRAGQADKGGPSGHTSKSFLLPLTIRCPRLCRCLGESCSSWEASDCQGRTLTHVGQGQVQQALHHRVDADRPDAARRSHGSAQHHRVLFVFGRQDLELMGDLHRRAALAEEVLRGEGTSPPSRSDLEPEPVLAGLLYKLSVTCHATHPPRPHPGAALGSPSVGREGTEQQDKAGHRANPNSTSELRGLNRTFQNQDGQTGQGTRQAGAEHRAPSPGATGRATGSEEAWRLEPGSGTSSRPWSERAREAHAVRPFLTRAPVPEPTASETQDDGITGHLWPSGPLPARPREGRLTSRQRVSYKWKPGDRLRPSLGPLRTPCLQGKARARGPGKKRDEQTWVLVLGGRGVTRERVRL